MKWLQERATIDRMLFLAGNASFAELDNIPLWHQQFADTALDVAIMPLANGAWSACACTNGATWSLVACIPSGEFSGAAAVARGVFFVDVFPHEWITGARAMSKAYDPAKPRMRATEMPQRPGFPTLASLHAGKNVLLGLADIVDDNCKLVTVRLSPQAEPRAVADVGAKAWYALHHNVMGAARLFWTGRNIIDNMRFAYMIMGLKQKQLRKRGICVEDDEVTAENILALSTLSY